MFGVIYRGEVRSESNCAERGFRVVKATKAGRHAFAPLLDLVAFIQALAVSRSPPAYFYLYSTAALLLPSPAPALTQPSTPVARTHIQHGGTHRYEAG